MANIYGSINFREALPKAGLTIIAMLLILRLPLFSVPKLTVA